MLTPGSGIVDFNLSFESSSEEGEKGNTYNGAVVLKGDAVHMSVFRAVTADDPSMLWVITPDSTSNDSGVMVN